MERSREGRRATAAAGNGSGLPRRRHRYRDSLEEDGGMEMQEMSRLRDRGSKKDRDRSGRIKRRRGERLMHASNREEGEDSSSESVDEDDDDEEDDVRLPPPPSNTGSAPSMSHNHHRKNFPVTGKAARPPGKAAEDPIGFAVPRRARTSSGKRSQEIYSGGGGDPIHQQTSTSSPPRRSPNAPVSPSSSSASVRKKIKPTASGGTKPRPPPKASKSLPVSEDIEIEVAEVLYGLTRQFQSQPNQDFHVPDSKDTNGPSTEASPASISHQSSSVTIPIPPPNMSSNTTLTSAVAPKKKRARQRMEEDNPSPSMAKVGPEPLKETEDSSPKITASPAVENGSSSGHGDKCDDRPQELGKPEIDPAADLKLSMGESASHGLTETKEEVLMHAKESHRMDLDVTREETSATKDSPVAEGSREVKYRIDLMAPPPGKSILETEGLSDYGANWKSPVVANLEMAEETETEKKTKPEFGETSGARDTENSMPPDIDTKKIEKDMTLNLQLDFNMSNSSQPRKLKATKNEPKPEEAGKQPLQKSQQKATKVEPKLEQAAHPVSLPMSMPVGGWPGSFPSFGYMGQVPSIPPVVPMEKSLGSSKTPPNFLTPQLRPKRCATHCYIAHKTQYHQQLSRINPFWPAAPGAAPVNGGKQYNLNAIPPSDSSIIGNLSQTKTPGSMQDKGGPSVSTYTGHSKDKISAVNTFTEAAQTKPQLVLQQAPQTGSSTNMLHGPTFLFAVSQQQAAAGAAAVAASAAAATARSGASKSTAGAGNTAAASSSSASPILAGSGLGGAASMSFNYPGIAPSEAQYMALLQNGGAYPFPIPSNVGAPPPYRGASAQAMLPFLNGSFYSPQLLHPQLQQQQQQPQQQQLQPQQQQQQQQPPQQQQQQPQQPSHSHAQQQPSHSHAQQGHPNTSTSSGSSSSQRPQRLPVGAAPTAAMSSSHNFPAMKKKQHLPTQGETGSDESPTTASSKASQAQKNIYNYNLAMAAQPQNFTLISPAVAALGSSGNHSEKQQQPTQHQSMKVDLTTSQAFAMSFASFGGAPAAATSPLQGFDFTSMAQNHALFQGLPEASMKGYQITAAAAGTSQTTQHKKAPHHGSEDGKSAGDRMNATVAGEEERKIMTTSKSATNAQHSLTFSRPNSDTSISNIHGNSVLDSSSRTLNLIKAPGGGGRASSRSASVAPPSSSSASPATLVLNSQMQQQVHHQQQQQQHQFIQHQMQQRQLQLQHQLVNRTKTSSTTPSATIYSDHLPAGSSMAKFPQALASFPQGLIQGGTGTQSPQWKAPSRGATPAPATSSPTSAAKNQPPQQQGRSMQQPFLPPGHQTQISFGVNSSKPSTPAAQPHHGSNNASMSQTPVSKNAGGSPRSSSGALPGTSQTTMLPLQQQHQPGKHSPSSSTQKSSPLRNSNTPSILGQSNMAPAPNGSSKQQQQLHSQQQHHQMQKQQAIPQAQFFFSNAYMPAQASHSNAAAAAGFYHQSRQSEPPQQQAQQNSSTTASEQPKAAAGGNTKGATTPGMLQHQAQFAAMAQSASAPPHTLMSAMAAAGAFPYNMHTVPPSKPTEQKPAAGNDNLHASWQPEKR